jgi:lipopolysaccharide transport system permease protein
MNKLIQEKFDFADFHTVIDANAREKLIDWQELWRYRDLFYILAWRDIKVRYKQTVLGALWAILQPLMTMGLFTVIFGMLIKVNTNGAPYPVFAFAALLPWQLFAFALAHASNSLINEKNMVTKVYFPRILVPFASVMAGFVDFVISFVILLTMLVIYRIPITSRIFTLPLFILLTLVSAMSVGLWLSALIVKYRDFQYVIPFLTQFWMYATPIAYASSLIPEQWRSFYALNPMVGVVEGFRWALIGSANLDLTSLLVSTGAILVIFIGGLLYYRRMEDSFADVI